MGVAIGTAVLVLVAFGISLVCLCVKKQRMKIYGEKNIYALECDREVAVTCM